LIILIEYGSLHGHSTNGEPIRAVLFNPVFYLPHQPCLAGLPGRPDSKKMTVFIGLTHNLMQTVFHKLRSGNAEVNVLIDWTIRMKPSHDSFLIIKSDLIVQGKHANRPRFKSLLKTKRKALQHAYLDCFHTCLMI
jgi:hypothetical protein